MLKIAIGMRKKDVLGEVGPLGFSSTVHAVDFEPRSSSAPYLVPQAGVIAMLDYGPT